MATKRPGTRRKTKRTAARKGPKATAKRRTVKRKTTAKRTGRKVARKSKSKPAAKRSTSKKKRSTAKRVGKKRSTAKRVGKKRATAKRSSVKKVRRKRSTRKSTMSKTASISGSFDGDIFSNGQLHIAPGAKFNANVKASNVQVDGQVVGCVTAGSTMKLGSKSQVKGKIVAPTLFAANGAAFEGYCKLGRRKAA
jgi:cytoskeletal protein CcmA (bactofilin family)